MKLVSVAEMVALEKAAVEAGLSYNDMMENAAAGLADHVDIAHSHLEEKTVLGLVGKGNNGGDTLIALALLAERGWQASGYIMDSRDPGDGLLDRLQSAGGKVVHQSQDKGLTKLRAAIRGHAILLDGILGTGIKLPLKDPAAGLLKSTRNTLAKLSSSPPVVIAVDCPSGVDCDTGEVADECIKADVSVCMAAVKLGMLQMPAFEYLGEIVVVDIGLPAKLKQWKKIERSVVDANLVRSLLPRRALDSHKGTFGTTLVVAGSANYTGAALLAGEAAYRVGAGLVSMAVPQSLWVALSGVFPEAIWVPLNEENGAISFTAVKEVQKHTPKASALLIGPGLGLEESTGKFLSGLLSGGGEPGSRAVGLLKRDQDLPGDSRAALPPMVVDADGLKLLAEIDNWHALLPAGSVLTPHPGEMAAMTGLSSRDVQEQRMAIAEKYAEKWGHVVVLKGAFTIISSPRGESAVIPVASPALARAGTGDVLAGMTAGLLAQGLGAFDAACSAAWMHAQAGLAAAREHGTTATVLARDLLRNLPGVYRDLDK